MITSSPYKKALEASKLKSMKGQVNDTDIKTGECFKGNSTKTGKGKQRSKEQRKCPVQSVRPVPTESQQTYHCIVCKEQYVEPIHEPWIACNICEDWSHEQCTDYAGYGPYICDYCRECN